MKIRSRNLPPAFPPPPQGRSTIREWDRLAEERFGIPSLILMERAGMGAADIIFRCLEERPEEYPEPVHILAGPGQNGGDGFVIARHLFLAERAVVLWVLSPEGALEGSDARVNLDCARRLGIPGAEVDRGPPPPPGGFLLGGTIIDALFGTGLSRPIAGTWLGWIEAVRAAGAPVIAVDTPSGLDADTGRILGAVLRARHTITFAAAKPGFYLECGPETCGEIHVVDIGLPRSLWRGAREEGGHGTIPIG